MLYIFFQKIKNRRGSVRWELRAGVFMGDAPGHKKNLLVGEFQFRVIAGRGFGKQ